jgi:hypothetical protein
MTSEALVIDGCAIATVDDADQEYGRGHLVIRDGRIDVVADGPAPAVEGARRVDGSGCLATPGFINVHHHLYQWITRGYAQDGTLFEWLTTLYPVWRHLDADLEYHAARGALASLALSGCTTTTDHHYVFPRDGGDLFAAEVEGPGRSDCDFIPVGGRWTLGSRGVACRRTPSSRIGTRSWRHANTRCRRTTIPRQIRCCGSRWRRARRSR